ncbi:aspartyl/asparaginyl beta-hydroxylase domain-containing protein [Luteolibacter luteus]|uniref:Aspartyl/asparaginyl beta-hydroxylase domain-containing protein n=1 Tax=Luteolibacter luteus TaxID=2728835 RepID=A0A858RMD2_9BACT|nr:aspartyl/asparaginyl beta-hydroxylase domain-containing protein [Luteolibacter luteus]QJE98147.1 aspartyl/asparaginyl beta-hydroxylase domain-containing protein [Luteolibacter luteus]
MSSLPTLPDRLLLPLRFDVARMQADLAVLEAGEWMQHFVKQNFDGDWSIIPLRGPAGATHPVMMMYSDPTCTEFADTPFLSRCSYFPEALAAFPFPLDCVRLMKLTPGSIIKEHCDHDLAFESGAVRIHVPVTTNPGVDFRLNGTRLDLREGTSWYLRLSDRHSVENHGATDRVHLVIDARRSPELDAWIATLDVETEVAA